MFSNDVKISAAREACKHVESGMRLGIGTGSTAEAFIHLLAEKIRSGLTVTGVPTSERTAALCRSLNVPLTDLDATPELDLTVDGADEVDGQLRLIKGGGGALLREKIVAAASAQMLVIADGSKLVDDLGQFPLPIEVNLFGLKSTHLAIEKCARELGLSGGIRLRLTEKSVAGPGTPGDAGVCYLTDGGHAILDASFGRIPDPEALAFALNAVPGVVEHGLFIGLASAAIIADEEGVRTLQASPSTETST